MADKYSELKNFHTILPDGGTMYAETNPEQYIVEPWNAFSSLFFLIPAIYWAIKIRGNLRSNGFIALCVPLLTLGGLGSTFFHAFRSSSVFLWMDVLPILLLTLSVAAYFWQKVFKNWFITIPLVITILLLRRFLIMSGFFPIHTAINLSYLVSGIAIFLPAIIVTYRTGFYKINSLLFSIGLFALALFFREIDTYKEHGFSMGTHFLWHISSAAGGFYLAAYLFHINKNPAEYSTVRESEKLY